jgi:hypothetical protein
VIDANPDAHTARIAMRVQSVVALVDGCSGTAPGNGWLICAIVNETAGVANFAAAGDHSRWLPRLISKVNGTKNLRDALNHNQ